LQSRLLGAAVAELSTLGDSGPISVNQRPHLQLMHPLARIGTFRMRPVNGQAGHGIKKVRSGKKKKKRKIKTGRPYHLQKEFVVCLICGSKLLKIRLESHARRVHRNSPSGAK
jgi:hypothetical protein